MRRRTFLRAVGAGGVAGLAGCTGGGGSDSGSTGTTAGTAASSTPELVVGTYGTFVDAPSTSPGQWIKETFESEFDATLSFATPDSEINYYIERANRGVDIEADVYTGVRVRDLIRIDEQLDDGLFTPVEGIPGQGDVKSDIQFDPNGRVVPFATGYVSLVYDETQGANGEYAAPETFEGLLDPEHEGDLLAQNPASSTTGRLFLLHTIQALGRDNYLDYWADLQDNGARVLGSWSDSYTAYQEGEAPMVVSYSTDQVYAVRSDEDLDQHQIRFLNDQGYADAEGIALFEGTDNPDLARSFVEFMLRPDVQGEIAQQWVSFPATTTADLPDSFSTYAKEPPEGVIFEYDTLRDNLSEWTRAWERQFASK
ncbi:thiamine ABC transporter substrate-binding protein [Halobellus ruber]|uniref:Thiamine ABC transporter substrate-binding protein n=1 Tax=Halobellus ruber TaxID=2761102 RepID=A0A7J9SPD9_9EURY|nr:thiamine ABC transporter substrate-binding protein [Halobellus ruber]MBB6647271.1 thiamine ABC transporter substrate-binding protein [Halobellus ruber]